MAGLIEELKREHVAIEELLTRVRDTSISNREAHRILIAAQEGLIAHLEKEDAELYPVLKRGAATQPALARTLELYAKDMDGITSNAVAFFEKYSPEDAPIDIEFARALGQLFSTVSRRMRNEEKTLYKAYEELVSAAV